MDHPDLTLSNFRENSIGLNRVKDRVKQLPQDTGWRGRDQLLYLYHG